MKRIILIFLSAVSLLANAQGRRSDTIQLRTPLDIPLLLSGNFGELRRNHFHSGVDFKTQGKTGLPVYAVDDGYVSRISVSPWGFGRAVYLTHPATGLTTVYGHLEAFAPKIDKRVRDRQYELETFTIDMTFEPGELPVSRGDIIARSGNAGSSGGPHLHFDVRDTATGEPLDPLEYYRKKVTDNMAPEVRLLAVYPVNGGVVEGNPVEGTYRQPQGNMTFTAWGDIVPGIKAYDRMNGTSNIYGVKYLTLLLDSDTIYRRVIDRYNFADTRAIHTIINNTDLVDNSSWIMTTRVADSNPLDYMISAKNNGVVNINEERPYSFTWILEDEHGNRSVKKFTVKGERKLSSAEVAKGQLMLWDADNVYDDEDIYIEFPAGVLYDNKFIEVTAKENPAYLSKVYSIGTPHIPLSGDISISMPLVTDTLADKNCYTLVRLNGTRRIAVPATYTDGFLNAKTNVLGDYAVTVDTTPPEIKLLSPRKGQPANVIKFKITDNLAGVDTWRGEIDGKFALFELDGKTSTLSFKMDPSRFPGKQHKVKLTVNDGNGNTSVYEGKI